MPRADARVAMLLEILDQAYDGKGWHGTTLRGALSRVSPAQARRRVSPRRHSIWELALHTAYWKYAVRRRLEGGRRGAFPRKPSNWPRMPARSDAVAWRADIAMLDAEHCALREAVARLPAARLAERSARGTWSLAEMVHGVAAHDVYHTGQIQLLRRMMPR